MPTSFSYWSLLRYFVATAATVTAAAITLLLLLSLCCYSLLLPLLLSHYFATDTCLQIQNLSGVVELTTQLLILENILWLPLCRINKFGLNTLPSKTVAIPYTCGLSVICSMMLPLCFNPYLLCEHH